MVIVIIVLCVIALAFSLFKILWFIDFINMKGIKKNKTKDNAEGNVTDTKENELNK